MPFRKKQFNRPGFTLVEVLVVIAILGILASIITIAINPSKRLKQARDSRRKIEIKQLSNGLQAYLLKFNFPAENWCDTSKGYYNNYCSLTTLTGSDWEKTGANNFLYKALVLDNKYLKNLPVDPTNDQTHFYELEVYVDATLANTSCSVATPCKYYWLGTRLEAPIDPTKAIFRCSNNTTLPNGEGCMEIAQGASPGLGNDDPDCTESDGDCW